MGVRQVWKCDVCGYIHNGDDPIDTCPICGVDWSNFSKVEIRQEDPPATGTNWKCTICEYVHRGSVPPEKCPVCNASANHFHSAPSDSKRDEGSKKRRIVIVGAGVAGLTAAEEAVKAGGGGLSIQLISKEPVLPYYRLNLTRYLAGEVNAAQLKMKPEDWFAEHGIRIVYGDVTSVDPSNREVALKNGDTISYDRLILANGSHPFIPPVPGIRREGVHPLKTLKDADAIIARARPDTPCVILGGGLLGLEAAGALRRRGVPVTVVENAPWLLPRQLTKKAGQMLQTHMESIGVRVEMGLSAKEIAGDESVKAVVLNDDKVLDARLVIVSTGVRPNSYLARQADITVGRGIVVNDKMYTSNEAILAAGDVAEHRGVVYGLWPTAYTQGMIAGINAAGGNASFNGMPPYNRLKVSDVDLYSVGTITPEDGSYRSWESATDSTFTYLLMRDNRIVGGVLYGDTSLANLISDAVESKANICELTELQRSLPDWKACEDQHPTGATANARR